MRWPEPKGKKPVAVQTAQEVLEFTLRRLGGWKAGVHLQTYSLSSVAQFLFFLYVTIPLLRGHTACPW